MNTPLISMRNIGKSYPMANYGVGRLHTIASLLSGSGNIPVHSVLEDVELEVARGESLGLIGENGAGKSTLLKIIAGVVKPSSGELHVNGSIGALLELGSGFHPEYTGRENIYLSAALMGLPKKDIFEKLESIIEFADIGEYIEQPIKHYSSGMVVRLGFAVATAMRPDILITDEVLAVGDESFQKKCISWMEAYLSDGGTLLLCSHGMFHIQKLCHKALWLHQGKMRRYGNAMEVGREYLAYHEEKSAKNDRARNDRIQAKVGTLGEYAVRKVWLENENLELTDCANMGSDVLICGQVFSPDGRPPVIGIGIVKQDGVAVYGVVSDMDNFVLDFLGNDLFGFKLRLQQTQLLPGQYVIRAHAMDPEGLRYFDTVECPLRITGQTRELGICRLRHAWERSGTPREAKS